MTDARIKRNDQITKLLRAFLEEVIKNPDGFSQVAAVKTALASQNDLALFSDPERGLVKRSLTTLKVSADRCIEGGFESLNNLRVRAAKAVKIDTRSERIATGRSKDKAELHDYKRQLTQAEQDLFHMSGILDRAMRQARNYAKSSSDPATIKLCQKEQRELTAALSLIKNPIVKQSEKAISPD